MKVLTYSQILSAFRKGKIKLDGVDFDLPLNIKEYIAGNLPAAGKFVVGKNALLVAMTDAETGSVSLSGGTIVMFLPSGPPDPGLGQDQSRHI